MTCTFWLVNNLIVLGEIDHARSLLEILRGCTRHQVLLSQQMDGQTGETLGNFPEPFSHMALINTAT